MTLDLLGLEFNGDGYASTQVDLDGHEVTVAVRFSQGVRRALLEGLAARVADLRQLESEARQSLRENLARGDEAYGMAFYRSHHIAELEPSLARRFFDVELSDPAADETFLRSMRLVRVGVDPEAERIVCDYTIGYEVTNYVIAVTFGPKGQAPEVSMES
jgi:hypothetical protein